jgi:hypothetical protein
MHGVWRICFIRIKHIDAIPRHDPTQSLRDAVFENFFSLVLPRERDQTSSNHDVLTVKQADGVQVSRKDLLAKGS